MTSPPAELDLHRLMVDEATARLDRCLNDAFLSGVVSVRVIHGKGTGTLRKAVREQLATHPLVESFRPGEREEGGDGATVAELFELPRHLRHSGKGD